MNLGPDVFADAADAYYTPDTCHCLGSGPWDVLVTIGGYFGSDASLSITHAACGQLMLPTMPEDISADGLPMRLAVVLTTDRGPDNSTRFVLTLRGDEDGAV